MKNRLGKSFVPGAPSLASAWRVLEEAGWLADCSDDDRELLSGISELRCFEAGEYIFRVGDEADGIYGFIEGAVDVGIPRIDGEMFVFHRTDVRTWVGDLALFSEKKRLVSLQAVERSVAVFLPRERLLDLIRAYPGVMRCFYRLSHENVELIFKLLGSLAVTGAENRVALRLLSLAAADATAQQVVEISQARLAQYVALSEQSVRRAVRKLEKAGLIESGYGRYRIVDRNGLAALCGYTA